MSQSDADVVLVVGAPAQVVDETRAALATDFTIEAADAASVRDRLRGPARPAALLVWAPPAQGGDTLSRTCAEAGIPLLLLVEERADEAQLLRLGACDYLTRPLQHVVARARLRAQVALHQAAPAGRGEPVLSLYAMRDRLRTLARQLACDGDLQGRRISGTLHDETAQDLAAACMYLSAALKNGGYGDDPLLAKANELVHKTLTDLRTLMIDISPPNLREHGLRAALEWLGERHGDRGGRPCRFEVGKDLAPLDEMPLSAAMQVARLVLAQLGGTGDDPPLHVLVDGDATQAVFVVRETGPGRDDDAALRDLRDTVLALGATVTGDRERPVRLRIELALD